MDTRVGERGVAYLTSTISDRHEAAPSSYLQFSPRAYRTVRALLITILALSAAIALVLAGLSLRWPLVHDAAIMQYIGWLMHQGAMPYRDVFDMNFPGTHLVHWLVLFIPGNMDLVWRCFDLSLLLATLILLTRLLPPRHYWSAAATCIAFTLYYIGMGPFYANGERDMFMTPLMIGGVIATVAMLEKERGRTWFAFLAGLLFGAACTIKPTGVVLPVVEMGFAGIWLLGHGQPWKRVTAILATAVLGACLPVAAIVAWLYATGALAPFLDIEMNYLPIYASAYAQYTNWSGWWERYPLNIVLLFVLLTSGYMISTGRVTARFGAAAVAVLGAAGHFVLQQKGFTFPYHIIPMVAFALPVAFWTLDRVVARRVVWPWCLSAGLAVMVLLPECEKGCRQAIAGPGVSQWRHNQAKQLAAYLKTNLQPGETVQVCEMVDDGIDALLRAGVRLPTRYTSDCSFFCHDPTIPYVAAMRKEFLDDLVRNRPQFVVFFKVCWFLETGYNRIDTFPEFKNWLNANYVRRVAQSNKYRIYERIDPKNL